MTPAPTSPDSPPHVGEPQTYTYEDRSLEPAEPIVVDTTPGVFVPTSTTRLVLRAIRSHLTGEVDSALDLGCGCGIVAVALRKLVAPHGFVGASDISPAAVSLTRHNASKLGVEIDVRCGSLFEPWEGHRFELIADDVAAMAEPIARRSRWYPPEVPSEAGEDGTWWITRILEEAPDHLAAGGRLVFPVLTLADHDRTLEVARERFGTVRLLEEEWYPLDAELQASLDVIEGLAARGMVELRRRGSRLLWATRVYLAEDPRAS